MIFKYLHDEIYCHQVNLGSILIGFRFQFKQNLNFVFVIGRIKILVIPTIGVVIKKLWRQGNRLGIPFLAYGLELVPLFLVAWLCYIYELILNIERIENHLGPLLTLFGLIAS
jgi:hypothetical protein